jgi:hypothetical protein
VALILSAARECHFYFARPVTFPSCADRRVNSARRTSGGILDQLGQLGDEALGHLNGLRRFFRRHFGAGAGLVVGNGFQVLGLREKRAQFWIEGASVFGEALKPSVDSVVSFCSPSVVLEDESLRSMESGEVSRGSRRVIVFRDYPLDAGIRLGSEWRHRKDVSQAAPPPDQQEQPQPSPGIFGARVL